MNEELLEHDDQPNQEKIRNDGCDEARTMALKKLPSANFNSTEVKPAGVLDAGLGRAARRIVVMPSMSGMAYWKESVTGRQLPLPLEGGGVTSTRKGTVGGNGGGGWSVGEGERSDDEEADEYSGSGAPSKKRS